MRVDGTPGNDVLAGTNNSDEIFGWEGNDQLSGLGGNDFLDGGSGNDTMDGGLGDDLFVIDSADDVVLEASNEGNDRVIALISYTLSAAAHMETLHTGNAASTSPLTLRGNDFAQSIYGNAGDNLLSGRGGNDYLVGAEGADILIGGTGNDVMNGGSGNDQYQVDTNLDQVMEVSGEGDDLVTTTVGYELAAGVSVETLAAADGSSGLSLSGNELAQSIYGDAGNNIIAGGGGVDYLVGWQGDDVYYITDGRERIAELDLGGYDIVYASVDYRLTDGAQVELVSAFPQTGTAAINLAGNEFANHMVGNDGNNILSGGRGTDVFSGRSGADIFLFDALGEEDADRVLDFVRGTDLLGLEDAVFTSLPSGALSPEAFRVGTFALDASDRIIHDPTTGNLWYDPDGSGPASMLNFGVIGAGITLSAADFMVM